MKLNEVPQDRSDYKGKGEGRKLMYATGPDGSYTSATSAGWDAEHAVTRDAWDAIDDDLAETAMNVRNGRLSPIAYFMKRSLMDTGILAAHMGRWRWTVRRHFRPAVFKKLSAKTLERYAAVFNITTDELKTFGDA